MSSNQDPSQENGSIESKYRFTEEQDLDPAATRELLSVLADLSPAQLKALSEYDGKLKRLVEKLEMQRAEQCLEVLKELTGAPYAHKSILNRIYKKASELLGFQDKRCSTLCTCSPFVKTMDFSLDPYLVDEPNRVLVEMAKHCVGVRSLNLNSCNLSLEGARALKELPHLESLSLSFCEQLTPEVLKEISELPLSGLKLSWNKQLPLEALDNIAHLENLQHLDISHTNITDEVMEVIGRLKNLCDINLDGCTFITDRGIEQLKNVPLLQSINLSSCKVSDALISRFHTLFPDLMSLTLRNNDLSDESIGMLSNLEELFYLDLSWSKRLEGTCLTSLAKLPQLHVLDLSRSTSLNPCHPVWPFFENLMILNLSRLWISAQTLHYVSQIPHLMRLNLSFCEGFLEEDLVCLTKIEELRYLDLTHSPISPKVHALFSKKATIKV
ncbi:MAG: hypothetical protein KDK48_02280 [Chlamydiia bacterium]|nr:hypothetical protein [Chlamydiia bacterium]